MKTPKNATATDGPPFEPRTNHMTAAEVGEMIFQAILVCLEKRGVSLEQFKSDRRKKIFPISHRTAYDIRKGAFTDATLKKLPFKVAFFYAAVTIEVPK